jgi:hypothetical protein
MGDYPLSNSLASGSAMIIGLLLSLTIMTMTDLSDLRIKALNLIIGLLIMINTLIYVFMPDNQYQNTFINTIIFINRILVCI